MGGGPGLKPLEFTDCLTDSPYFREKLHTHEKELERTSQQIKGLVKEVKDLLNAARQLSRAQRTLSKSLINFNFECIGTSQTDDEVGISHSLKEFGELIGRIEDQRDMMLERAYDQIIHPLEEFRKTHIGNVKEGKKKFEKETAKFCASQERYLNLSTKKQDTVLKEADAALVMEQRCFSQASLEYVFLLQEVQERKKFEFVETLMGFMYGWLTFYHEGHEVALEFKPYMRELQFKIQKTRDNFNATRDKTETLMKKMLEVRQTKSMDACSLNKNIRVGYLLLMEKRAFGTTWTKHYCTYYRETKRFEMIPYNQMTGKFNSTEIMVLSSCVRRMSDSIEKRFCFDVTSNDRPGVVFTLQALSEEDRKLWMDVMDGKEPTYAPPVPIKTIKPTEERPLDEVGFTFVTRCIEVLESRGLEEQGLYRVVGVSSKVTKLLQMGLDRRKSQDKLLWLDDNSEWESKTITSALKTYLRNLPEPLMTFQYHNSFLAAAKQETRQLRLNDVHTLIHRLPQANRNMLDLLTNHLRQVANKCDRNLMTVSNLGVCFGPTLLRPEEETVAAIMEIKFCNVIVEILIENFEKIFKSAPEVDSLAQHISPHHSPSPRAALRYSPHAPPPASQGPPPVTHAIIRTYYDGPVSVSLGASLHTVSDRYQKAHPDRDRLGPAGAYSDSNLLAMNNASSNLYKNKPAFHYPNSVNHERLDSATTNNTSSSNESISSDVNNYVPSATSPQKSKRGTKLGVHYATSYRTDSLMTRSTSSVPSCRSSPANPGIRRVRTLYTCLSENDGELSFEPNQIITNVKRSLEPGWLEGTLNGKTGLVPENYVEFLP